MLLFASMGMGSNITIAEPPRTSPQWDIQTIERGAEIKITWSKAVTVNVRRRDGEVTLGFSSALGEVPAARMMSQLPLYLRNIEYGYDTLLFEFKRGVSAQVLETGSGVTIVLTRPENRQSHSATNSGVAADDADLEDAVQARQRLALLRAVARLEAGDVVRARRALEQLHRHDPEDVGVASALARAQEIGGAWRDAVQTASEIYKRNPDDPEAVALRDRLDASYGDRADVRFGFRHGDNRERQHSMGVKGRNLLGRHTYLLWDIEHRELEYGEFVRADGDRQSFEGSRHTSAVGLGFVDGEQDYRIGLASDARTVGVEGRYELGGPGLSFAMSAGIDLPYTDSIEARIQHATRRGLDLFLRGTSTGQWFAAGGMGWRQYDVSNVGKVGSSVRGSATIGYSFIAANTVISYSVDIERFADITTHEGTDIPLLPIRSRNVHGVAVEFQQKLTQVWRVRETIGYAYSEQGEHEPFAHFSFMRTQPRSRELKVGANRTLDWKRAGGKAVTEVDLIAPIY